MRRWLPILCIVVASAACAAESDKYPPGVTTAKQYQEAIGGSFYAEHPKDGRVYVIGREATNASFQKTGELQFAKTYVGAGPNGTTVVLEVNDKAPQLAERLAAEYSKRNGVSLQ